MKYYKLGNMDNSNESSTIQTADIILVACIVVILFVTAFWTCRMCCKPDVQPVRIEVVTSDSLEQKNYLSKEQADSLIMIVKRHEQELAEKYQYALEQKMDQGQYYSLGTFIVGVVLSIFGFFGYKSIKSIELKANKDAERVAKQTSEDVTKDYLNEKLQGKVSIAAEKIFNSVGAETMKAKVLDETIKHDDKYINVQVKSLKEELEEYVRTKVQQINDEKQVGDNQTETEQQTATSSVESSDSSNMF